MLHDSRVSRLQPYRYSSTGLEESGREERGLRLKGAPRENGMMEAMRGLSPERITDLDRHRKVSFSTAPIPVGEKKDSDDSLGISRKNREVRKRYDPIERSTRSCRKIRSM